MRIKALNILDFSPKYVILYNVNFASVVWQMLSGQKEVALSRKLPSSAQSDRKRIIDRSIFHMKHCTSGSLLKPGTAAGIARQRQRLELYPFAGSVPKGAVGRQVFNVTCQNPFIGVCSMPRCVRRVKWDRQYVGSCFYLA